MNILDQLTPGQKQLIIALPFRVGLYISKADTTGGSEADEEEERALENIIEGFADYMLGAEPIQYIMTETLKHKPNWSQWRADIKGVPRECHEMLEMMDLYLSKKEIDAFIKYLMQIAEAVALAFREYEHYDSLSQKAMMYVNYAESCITRARAKMQIQTLDEFLRISLDERKALKRVASALKTTY